MEKLTSDILINLLEKIEKRAIKETCKSLNHLPEYYLNVKLSDALYKLGYGFEIEKPAKEVAQNLKIDLDILKFPNEKIKKRIESGRIDLVVTTREKRSLRNLIELKMGTKNSTLKLDVDRLAWFSQQTSKRSMQRSFLIFSTTKSITSIDKTISILDDSYEDLLFKYQILNSKTRSTRKKTQGKCVSTVVLEVKQRGLTT